MGGPLSVALSEVYKVKIENVVIPSKSVFFVLFDGLNYLQDGRQKLQNAVNERQLMVILIIQK